VNGGLIPVEYFRGKWKKEKGHTKTKKSKAAKKIDTEKG